MTSVGATIKVIFALFFSETEKPPRFFQNRNVPQHTVISMTSKKINPRTEFGLSLRQKPKAADIPEIINTTMDDKKGKTFFIGWIF